MEIQGIKNGNTRDKEWRYPSKLYQTRIKERYCILYLEKCFILTFSQFVFAA